MLTRLPIELVEMIFDNLDANSLNVCCLVSKAFNRIITNDVAAKKLNRAIKSQPIAVYNPIQNLRQYYPRANNLRILSLFEQNAHKMPPDQWQCHFLVKNASHYQIRYTEDYGDFGYYSGVYPDYDFTQPMVNHLAHANYTSLSDATKALAKISANQDARDSYFYPCALKIFTSFDLVEYISDEIDNSRVFVCHWSIVLIE